MLKLSVLPVLFFAAFFSGSNQPTALSETPVTEQEAIKPLKTGAEQTEKYLPYLKGKRIGIVGNKPR